MTTPTKLPKGNPRGVRSREVGAQFEIEGEVYELMQYGEAERQTPQFVQALRDLRKSAAGGIDIDDGTVCSGCPIRYAGPEPALGGHCVCAPGGDVILVPADWVPIFRLLRPSKS